MPTYLCHGFRWKRDSIRFLILMNDIDDATPDWVVTPKGGAAILAQLHRSFDFIPDVEGDPQPPEGEADADEGDGEGGSGGGGGDALARCWWSAVKLLEEWDLSEEKACSRPYAYLADYAVRLGDEAAAGKKGTEVAEIEEAKRAYAGGGEWFGKLRDGLQAGEEIGWYTVVCEDEERAL
ncbi:hypothetical protein N3K66_008057 [Trichothecium roseum]|uniref:Uncharacterized protein n=1 Tax=Trichothecium roseum TaxID=47278 RepID=A0ACC0USD3_9HYPO|nr:hypothetical protein N3K66_008057 [Trichothecium roseum]